MVVAPGQGHDGQMLPDLLDETRVPRLGPGWPRVTPDKVLGNKAYFSRATRTRRLPSALMAIGRLVSSRRVAGTSGLCPSLRQARAPWQGSPCSLVA